MAALHSGARRSAGGARALEPNGRLTETAIEIAPPDRQPAAA
jgi:hypothetical protein